MGADSSVFTATIQSEDFIPAANCTAPEIPRQIISFGFTVPQSANYNTVKVVLTDSEDETQKLVFNYRNTSSTSYFSINDGVEYNLGTKMNNSAFVLSYKNAEKIVTAGVDMNYGVEKDFYGNDWNGFGCRYLWKI